MSYTCAAWCMCLFVCCISPPPHWAMPPSLLGTAHINTVFLGVLSKLTRMTSGIFLYILVDSVFRRLDYHQHQLDFNLANDNHHHHHHYHHYDPLPTSFPQEESMRLSFGLWEVALLLLTIFLSAFTLRNTRNPINQFQFSFLDYFGQARQRSRRRALLQK